MGNILADIVEEIDIKPNKSKLILKWVIGISGSLIVTAFLLGQLKMKRINRLDRIETNQIEMKAENRNGFKDVNAKIDKVYGDGLVMFNEFQENNNKQLELIIDYVSEVHFIEVEGIDTIFHLSGATKKYINSIDKSKYEVGAMIESPQYPGRFDVSYRNK